MKTIVILIIMIGLIGCSQKIEPTMSTSADNSNTTFKVPKEIHPYHDNEKAQDINQEINKKREIEKTLQEHEYLKKHGMELSPATQILNTL